MDNCKACGAELLFSAREIGTGYCHCCGHRRYVAAVKWRNAAVFLLLIMAAVVVAVTLWPE